MDTIPLINPKLIKVSATADITSGAVLRAEVVSSTPIRQTDKSSDNEPSKEPQPNSSRTKPQENQSQEYKVTLKVGKQQLETISTDNFKKGSELEVKILPGPELKIINKSLENQPTTAQLTASQTLALQAKPLVQQLLADRIPQVQQQELPNLIKQLSQIINPQLSKQQNSSPLNPISTELQARSQITTRPTNQQTLANMFYQQQSKTGSLQKNTINSTSANPPSTDSMVKQLKNWMLQLPKGQDIASSSGLRNALNNAGIQAEAQLGDLAQLSSNLPQKKSANSIFQQLQTLQQDPIKGLSSKESLLPEPMKNTASIIPVEPKSDLASIIKKTAKILSDNSQQVLSSLMKTNVLTNDTKSNILKSTNIQTPLLSSTTATTSATIPTWQNPLLNNALMSFDELLQTPLLQNPSSNNKFALSQILIAHTLNNQGSGPDSDFRIPLNWSVSSGSDNTLIRNLQTLLGHIEREQIQQMQTAESNQNTNPNQLQQSQQWIPLLINHQQQLQLIEFFLDKEERVDASGEKKQHWFINLHFDLPIMGKLGVEICMLDNECSTTFWSESSSSLSHLTQHLQPLRQRLLEQGIIVSDIHSRHGTLEKRKHNIQQRLVDVKT